jgi:hypothetical protein
MIMSENKSPKHSYSLRKTLAFVGLVNKIMRKVGFYSHANQMDVIVELEKKMERINLI